MGPLKTTASFPPVASGATCLKLLHINCAAGSYSPSDVTVADGLTLQFIISFILLSVNIKTISMMTYKTLLYGLTPRVPCVFD